MSIWSIVLPAAHSVPAEEKGPNVAVDEDRSALFRAAEILGDVVGHLIAVPDMEIGEAKGLIAQVYGSDEPSDIQEALTKMGSAAGKLEDVVAELTAAKEKVNTVAERFGR
jgi:hypothetical protein